MCLLKSDYSVPRYPVGLRVGGSQEQARKLFVSPINLLVRYPGSGYPNIADKHKSYSGFTRDFMHDAKVP